MSSIPVRGRPTLYRAVGFRSMLEARWAVYFDVLGVVWIHEPQTFRLQNGRNYLPDYHLPVLNAHLEVKPRDYLDDIAKDPDKQKSFEKAWGLASITREDVILMAGEPRRQNGKGFRWISTEQGCQVGDTSWYICSQCGLAMTTFREHPLCHCGQGFRDFSHPRLLAAQLLSMECNFMHGNIQIGLEG